MHVCMHACMQICIYVCMYVCACTCAYDDLFDANQTCINQSTNIELQFDQLLQDKSCHGRWNFRTCHAKQTVFVQLFSQYRQMSLSKRQSGGNERRGSCSKSMAPCVVASVRPKPGVLHRNPGVLHRVDTLLTSEAIKQVLKTCAQRALLVN